MKFMEALQVAARALAANKLRSVLTRLGIIIGVGAVIALMSIGAGVQKYVTDQFAGLGSNAARFWQWRCCLAVSPSLGFHAGEHDSDAVHG